MNKKKEKIGYQEWVDAEKRESAKAYSRYRVSGVRKILPVPERSRRIVFSTAAAILILTMGTTVWIKKDDIFKPKFSDDQIELAYEHTIKILSCYSQSLSKSFTPIKNIKLEIPNDNQ